MHHPLLRTAVPAAVILSLAAIFALPALSASEDGPKRRPPRGFRSVQHLLDLSGLAWMGGDTFLAVHDAKYPDESGRVRVSLLQLPVTLEDGLLWKPLRLRFPGQPSSDLESAARIPGTSQVLLAESGDDASGRDRIYRARLSRNRVRVIDALAWSSFTDVFNVEATAVAKTGDGHLFLWAERAEGSATTRLQWRDLRLDPFAIGTGRITGSVSFTLPEPWAARYNRPIVGLDVDASGKIFSVAAFDPNCDDGPFRSAVFTIGRVVADKIVLDAAPTLVETAGGLKIESIAVHGRDEKRQIFIGTDDENYGGILRPLAPAP